MNGLLYLLFFSSGLSGLIYQVVWVREFGNVFGNTVYSAVHFFSPARSTKPFLSSNWP